MNYPYKVHQIQEIMEKDKCLSPGDKLGVEGSGGSVTGLHFETRPQLKDGPFLDMRYLGKAPLPRETTSYESSFLLANQRVRGVGYDAVGRQNFRFKQKIPKGWHVNFLDPNLPTNDPKRNIHHPLPEFSVTDFHAFINQTARDISSAQSLSLF